MENWRINNFANLFREFRITKILMQEPGSINFNRVKFRKCLKPRSKFRSVVRKKTVWISGRTICGKTFCRLFKLSNFEPKINHKDLSNNINYRHRNWELSFRIFLVAVDLRVRKKDEFEHRDPSTPKMHFWNFRPETGGKTKHHFYQLNMCCFKFSMLLLLNEIKLMVAETFIVGSCVDSLNDQTFKNLTIRVLKQETKKKVVQWDPHPKKLKFFNENSMKEIRPVIVVKQ